MARWADGAAERKHRHDLRRETILQAAAQCFNRRGYHGTRIEDIAHELKVSKAALYYYVKSKEQLLFECHQASLDISEEGLRRAEERGGTAAEQLTAALTYFIEKTSENLRGCVLLLEDGMLEPRLRRQIIRRRDAFEHRLRDLVREGSASGVFVACDPRMVVFAILGAVNWIQRWYSPAGPATPRRIAEIFAGYLVRGLETMPPATPGEADTRPRAVGAPCGHVSTHSEGERHV
jgi:TetR/AcrR family transcriptional regulator